MAIYRAVYSRADIYLLDDPLSALDVRVARHVKEKCIDGLLLGRCVVLVTHQTHFLRDRVKEVISIQHGEIVSRGSYDEVLGGSSSEEYQESLTLDDIDMEEARNEIQTKVETDLFTAYGTFPRGPEKSVEIRRSGSIGWKLVAKFFSTGNSGITLVLVAILPVFLQILMNGSDVLLKAW